MSVAAAAAAVKTPADDEKYLLEVQFGHGGWRMVTGPWKATDPMTRVHEYTAKRVKLDTKEFVLLDSQTGKTIPDGACVKQYGSVVELDGVNSVLVMWWTAAAADNTIYAMERSLALSHSLDRTLEAETDAVFFPWRVPVKEVDTVPTGATLCACIARNRWCQATSPSDEWWTVYQKLIQNELFQRAAMQLGLVAVRGQYVYHVKSKETDLARAKEAWESMTDRQKGDLNGRQVVQELLRVIGRRENQKQEGVSKITTTRIDPVTGGRAQTIALIPCGRTFVMGPAIVDRGPDARDRTRTTQL